MRGKWGVPDSCLAPPTPTFRVCAVGAVLPALPPRDKCPAEVLHPCLAAPLPFPRLAGPAAVRLWPFLLPPNHSASLSDLYRLQEWAGPSGRGCLGNDLVLPPLPSETPQAGLCAASSPQASDHGFLPGGRIPQAAGEPEAAGRAPQQVSHPPGGSHGAVVPPQGAAGLCSALAARQVPAGPVSATQGSGGGHPAQHPAFRPPLPPPSAGLLPLLTGPIPTSVKPSL